MKTNDLKKGTIVRLRNGWQAVIQDNARGNTRIALVYGFETEMGSVYSHDIIHYKNSAGWWGNVEHTPGQLKCKALNDSFFA